jgi:Pyridoxamine 5'-phosphate oxidase
MAEWGYDGGLGLAQPASGAQQLDGAEAMRLLASVGYGWVVFTLNALPAIRPVNHLVDEGRVIIRTQLTSAISTAVRSTDVVVVAYEADSIDRAPAPRLAPRARRRIDASAKPIVGVLGERNR